MQTVRTPRLLREVCGPDTGLMNSMGHWLGRRRCGRLQQHARGQDHHRRVRRQLQPARHGGAQLQGADRQGWPGHRRHAGRAGRLDAGFAGCRCGNPASQEKEPSQSRKSSWWEGAVARPCGLIKLLASRRNVADGARRVRLFQRMGSDADSCLVCDRATWAFFSAANKEVICASPP